MKKVLKLSLLTFAILALLAIITSCKLATFEPDDTPSETINITEKYGENVVIVYGSEVSGAVSIAYDIQDVLYTAGYEYEFVSDANANAECEILVGKTNRELSKKLEDEAAKLTNAVYVWGYAYEDGRLAYYYNSRDAYDYSIEDFKARFIEDEGIVIQNGYFEIFSKTQQDIDKEENDMISDEREKRLEALKAANNAFTDDMFGEAELMPTNAFPAPSYNVSEVSHPRLLVNANTLDSLKALLSKDSTDTTYVQMRAQFWRYADAKDVTGVFVEKGDPILYQNGTPNDTSDDYYLKNKFDLEILAQVEAKALAYLITGDEIYGYEAIVACKNMMLTLRYWDNKQQDTYWGASMTAAIVALVYDWCYDLLTGRDMQQIIGGVRTHLLTQLEFAYPPSNMNGVSGHGTGRQMFIDYLSLAVAFADERPDWWAYVGGRFYHEYIPVINEMYSSGFVSQGTYYGTRKWDYHARSAYILDVYGDTSSIDAGFANTAYSIAAQILPNGNFMQTGDNRGWRNHYPGGDPTVGAYWMIISAGLTQDPSFLNLARKYSNNFTALELNEYRLSPAMYGVFVARCLDVKTDESAKLPLIVYNGHPGGHTIIKNSLSENAAYAYMRVLDKTMANHEHSDSGTFQIYYKGLLACESGYYKGVLYGKEHHRYYLTATVAHNGMLVYDPAYRDTLDASVRKYYSGSQLRLSEAGTIEKWNSGIYDIAKILGHAEGYYEDGGSKFAYISGNTTNAYVTETVDYVKRSMLTVMTESDDIPMLFFVYDDVTSKNADAIKKFLLHTVNEPSVDGNTAIVTEGNGKLVLTSLLGADKIEKIGGEGKGFWVGEDGENGYNVADKVEDGWEDSLWGRIEISAYGENTDKMLNVMYVTDKDSTATITPTLIETDKLVGAVMGDTVGVFMKARTGESEEFSIITNGNDSISYYVCGLAYGTWVLNHNGNKLGTVEVTEDSGMICFNAPAGEITLTPKAVKVDYSISYELAGGYFDESAPDSYTFGNGIASLPMPIHDRGTFLGWYTDAEYLNPITEITAEQEGDLTLYAKWQKLPAIYVDTDCENTKGVEGWSGTTLPTTIGGESVIKWTPSVGNKIHTYDASEGYGAMSGDKHAVSFTVSMARDADAQVVKSVFRIMDDNSKELRIFAIDENGTVTLGEYGNGAVIGTLTDELLTVRIVLYFENETLTAYLADGTSLSVTAEIPDKSYETLEEWRESFGDSKRIFNWRAESEGTLYIDKITVTEGNIFESAENVTYPIVYELGGGSFEGAYTATYAMGVGLAQLPTPTMNDATFMGWYKDAAFTTQVDSILPDSIGTVTVYAKWQKPPAVYVDYDCEDTKGNVEWSGVTLPTTLNGATVIKWTPAAGNKLHTVSADDGYGIMYSDERSVSFTVSLARDVGTVVKSVFRIMHPNGGKSLNIFTIDESGIVRLGGYTTSAVICTLTEDITTLNIVVDFTSEKLIAYKDDGTTVELSVKDHDTAYASLDAWRVDFCNSKNIFNWRAASEGTLYVDKIKISEGNAFD